MRAIIWGLASFALVLGPATVAFSTEPAKAEVNTADEPRAAGLIVEITKSDISQKSIAAIEDVAEVEVVNVDDYSKNVQVLDFDQVVDAETIADAVAVAEERSDVISAEPNWIIQAADLNPADYYWSDQYGLWDSRTSLNDGVTTTTLSSGGYSIKAPALWKATTGSSNVVVAVLDTGVVKSHPDLSGQFIGGYDFFSGFDDSPDNRDGTAGPDADPADPGDWQLVGDTPCPDSPINGRAIYPSSWHGTAVSSLVAANADKQGIVGVAPSVKILPVRVLGCRGGTTEDLAKAIQWSAGITVDGIPNPNPAKVINMSLSSDPGALCEDTVQSAITAARNKGAVIIASRGNDNSSEATSPSNCDGVIGVAATDDLGKRARYSNWGTANGTDIAAPGGGKVDNSVVPFKNYSAVILAANNGVTVPEDDDWSASIGTSMAAPLVAGGAALMASLGYSRSEIETALGYAVQPFPTARSAYNPYNCTTSSCGKGILDLSKVPAFVNNKATIGGSPVVGNTLSVPAVVGSPSMSYQWYRGSKKISKATKTKLKLTNTDAGKTLKVKVSGKKTGFKSLSATPSIKVYKRATVSGTMKSGKTVKASTSKWPTSGWTYSYQWYRSGKAIVGATGKSLKLTKSDRKKKITVKVTATRSGYPTLTSVSAARKVK